METKTAYTDEEQLCKCGHEKRLHAKTLYGKDHPSDICYGYGKVDRLCTCIKFREK